MPERLVGEIMFDPEYSDKYLAIRERISVNGESFGEIIAFGDNPDEVHAKLVEDQKINGVAKRFFHKPIEVENNRDGWTIEGNK